MLILERKEGEKIVVQTSQGEVVIEIQSAKHGKAKVGIDAPKECGISREKKE